MTMQFASSFAPSNNADARGASDDHTKNEDLSARQRRTGPQHVTDSKQRKRNGTPDSPRLVAQLLGLSHAPDQRAGTCGHIGPRVRPRGGCIMKCRNRDRSTTTRAQQRRTLQALRQRPQTTHDLRRIGIYHPCGRVRELRTAGYLIGTDRVALWDSDGYRHAGCARYVLMIEPLGDPLGINTPKAEP